MGALFPSAGLSLALALAATPFVIWLSARLGVLDRPTLDHKTHTLPAATLGGLAVVFAASASALAFGLDPGWGLVVYSACLSLAVIGALDDLFNLSPWTKLCAELLAASAVCAAGLTLPAGPAWIAIPATVLWLATCANGFNLTDGVDGLAAFTGIAAAAGLALLAYLGGALELAALLVVLMAALAGFLVFNFPRARIFLGDSGALPIGLFLGVCAVAWARVASSHTAALAPVFALALPLGETVLSTVRRKLRGRPMFRADQRHIHHRLAARGWPSPKITLACAAYSLAGSATAGVVGSNGAAPSSFAAMAAFGLLSFAGLRYLRYAELECAAGRLWSARTSSTLAEQIALTERREELETAADPDRRWELVVLSLRELGFREVRLFDRSGRPLRESSARRDGLECVWKLRVHLPDGEGVLEAERAIDDAGETRVSADLEQLLSRAFVREAPRRRSGAESPAR
ncbi:MAG: undecaprenyl/decaprenyl-phosphate alpha-N-acetylglucosaminyl 1-phosphate transferase [Acidobacteria bacterium]|nr:undecaprenyl/decaprenyl-phosphate alpha-N-acetylglucosaminyl 1-phosphate transferase [Acidobacteriota bacterium]